MFLDVRMKKDQLCVVIVIVLHFLSERERKRERSVSVKSLIWLCCGGQDLES